MCYLDREELMGDCFFYSGSIRRGYDFPFMEFVSENQQHSELMLILSTYGGDSNAAYKIGRYLQSRYESIVVFVPGLCKSAGTLLAIAARELVFSPYGELGPLDIQIMKTDRIANFESGLSIGAAFKVLESRAKNMFHELVLEITGGSGTAVSFPTASRSASRIVSSIFGPISARIDPEEVGSRARALQICADYGIRLNRKFQNLKDDREIDAIRILSETYASHDFAIDVEEAAQLFNNVRLADESERKLATDIGVVCRIPEQGQPKMENHTENLQKIKAGRKDNDEEGKTEGPTTSKGASDKSKDNGGDSREASEKGRSTPSGNKPASDS